MIHRKYAAVQFVIKATSHRHHKVYSGEIVFGRIMLHQFSTQVKWGDILRQKHMSIDKANVCENTGRRFHDYLVSDQLLSLNKVYHIGKIEPTTLPEGPWGKLYKHTHMEPCPFNEENILNE